MTGKDAGGRPARKSWKNSFSLLVATLLVVTACVAVRNFWGPGRAQADGPQGRISARPVSKASVSGAKATITDSAAAGAARSAPLGAASTTATAPAEQSASVMAVVNGEQITRQDLARECLKRYGEEVLESIVSKHLIWQACQQQNIVITEQDVEDEITRMAAKWGLSAERYLQMLYEERDLTPEQYRREIVWQTLALRRLVREQIEVTPEELRRAFEAEYGPRVQARMISHSSRQKAEEIRAQAAARPDDFGTLAKDFSEDQHSASARGVIPPIRKHLGDANLERIAFGLREGEVSPVISVGNQYIILLCEKHIPETVISSEFRQTIDERTRDQVRERKMFEAAPKLFQSLQAQAKIVNVYNDPQQQQRHPGVAALINDQPVTIQQLSEECVVRHGRDVLDGEINRKILQQELRRAGKSVTPESIDQEIARAAESYNYKKADNTPDIEAWLKYITEENGATVELYVRDVVWPTVALKALVQDRVSVSEEDLTKGFESNYGERVELLAIVLGSQRQAQEVWEMARNNPTDQFFGELAHQYSIEPVSKANFGKVDPIPRHGGHRLLEQEAFRLKPGELSGVISIADKHIIIRCLGRTKPIVDNIAAVRNELYKDLYERKLRMAMVEELDRVKQTAQIDNFLVGTSQPGKAAVTAAPVSKSSRAGSAVSAR